MIMVNLLTINQKIFPTRIMSQFQVTIKILLNKKRHTHGKPLNVYEKLHLYPETETEIPYDGTTYDSIKHHGYNDEMTPFDKKTVLSLQTLTLVNMLLSLFWLHSKICQYIY